MSEPKAAEAATMCRSGFHIFVVLCLVNVSIWYLVHDFNYRLGAALLGAAFFFDICWPKIVRSLERNVQKSESNTTPVSQNGIPIENSEEQKIPMNTDNAPAPPTQPQQQNSEFDDHWDEVYRQCVEQNRKAGNKAQTGRRRG